MLSLFRQNLFFNSLLLLPYTIIIRIHSLIHPESYASSEIEGWFNFTLFEWMKHVPILQSILAILLIFLQAVTINYLVNRHRLSLRPNLFPGVFYILLISISKESLYLNPVILANIFFLLAVVNLFKTYRVAQVSTSIFNSAFFIAIASLFYLPALLYLLPCFIALFMLRSFRVKERMQYILGAVTSLYLAFSIFFYYGLHSSFFQSYFIKNIALPYVSEIEYAALIPLVLIVFALIAVTTNYYSLRKKKSIQSQRKIDILYWFLLFSPLMLLLWYRIDSLGVLLLSMPLSILIGMILYRMKNQFVAELIHIIAIAVIFITHFGLI